MNYRDQVYTILVAAFSVIVVISNVISAKIVMIPWINASIPAGLLIYPLTFLLSDLVTESFGAKKAKLMVYTALAMNVISLGMIEIALLMPSEMVSNQAAYQEVLGLSGLRILSSLTAYLISQVVAIQIYARIRQWTGDRFLWFRNSGSTCISQLIDTLVIDIMFLWWGLGMAMDQVWLIMLFSYGYKTFFSFVCIPLFYASVYTVRKFLIHNQREGMYGM